MTAAPLTAEDPPDASYSYEELHRAGKRGVWRPIVGVIALAAIAYAVAPLVMQMLLAVWLGVAGKPVQSEMDRILDLSNPTPAGLAIVNLILASAILTTWLINRVLHGLKPRWLASIQPRIRWRFLGICLGSGRRCADSRAVCLIVHLGRGSGRRHWSRRQRIHSHGSQLCPGRAAAHAAAGRR